MNIAIIGYGVVGGGVHRLLQDGALGITVRRLMDIRTIEGLEGLLTDNIGDIIGDPAIDCVVETIGGMHPALSYVTAALRAGKHVITSNKEMVSHSLAPLLEGAAVHGAQFRFSAAVGGGIPWIHNLVRVRRADTILHIEGILNGTTNYILDEMASGAAFEEALSQAQQKGYTELDPTADLLSLDVQRKCAISAALAFDTIVEPEQVPTLGIVGVQREDIEAFTAQGTVCKLMMMAARREGAICAYVQPMLIRQEEILAHVPKNFNLATLVGARTGRLSFYGEGAGRCPTAANVVGDLLDIRDGTKFPAVAGHPVPVDNSGECFRYYIRTTAQEVVAHFGEGTMGSGVVTRPMSVLALHALAGELRALDAQAFLAALPRDEG